MTPLTSVDVVKSMTTFLQSQRDSLRMVDGIGGSDNFVAGPVRQFVNGRHLAAALMFAAAASALQQTISGDFNQVSVSKVERLIAEDASGRAQV